MPTNRTNMGSRQLSKLTHISMLPATLGTWTRDQWKAITKPINCSLQAGFKGQVWGTGLQPLFNSFGNLRVCQTMLCQHSSIPLYRLPIPRQDISTDVLTARCMHNLQIQLSQALQPTSLARIQMRLSVEVSERLVVSEHCACITMQVLPPLSTCCINSHKLPISYMIPCFSWCELLAEICHRSSTL